MGSEYSSFFIFLSLSLFLEMRVVLLVLVYVTSNTGGKETWQRNVEVSFLRPSVWPFVNADF